MAEAMRPLMREGEVRRLMGGISQRKMRQLRRRGLPHVRLGGRTILYRPEDVEAWVAAQAGGGG